MVSESSHAAAAIAALDHTLIAVKYIAGGLWPALTPVQTPDPEIPPGLV